MIKLAAISDLHGYLPKIDTCDIVTISGDIVPLQVQRNIPNSRDWFKYTFSSWVNSLPCEEVVFIGGNHDKFLELASLDNIYDNIIQPTNGKAVYLEDSKYYYVDSSGEIHLIYGTPACHKFGNWSFMYSDEGLKDIYDLIPENVDILLTHDQPYGYDDVILQKDCPWASGEHIGCKPLADVILEKQPKYLFCGHLHTTGRGPTKIGNTIRYNVSIKDEFYNVFQEPLYLSI